MVRGILLFIGFPDARHKNRMTLTVREASTENVFRLKLLHPTLVAAVREKLHVGDVVHFRRGRPGPDLGSSSSSFGDAFAPFACASQSVDVDVLMNANESTSAVRDEAREDDSAFDVTIATCENALFVEVLAPPQEEGDVVPTRRKIKKKDVLKYRGWCWTGQRERERTTMSRRQQHGGSFPPLPCRTLGRYFELLNELIEVVVLAKVFVHGTYCYSVVDLAGFRFARCFADYVGSRGLHPDLSSSRSLEDDSDTTSDARRGDQLMRFLMYVDNDDDEEHEMENGDAGAEGAGDLQGGGGKTDGLGDEFEKRLFLDDSFMQLHQQEPMRHHGGAKHPCQDLDEIQRRDEGTSEGSSKFRVCTEGLQVGKTLVVKVLGIERANPGGAASSSKSCRGEQQLLSDAILLRVATYSRKHVELLRQRKCAESPAETNNDPGLLQCRGEPKVQEFDGHVQAETEQAEAMRDVFRWRLENEPVVHFGDPLARVVKVLEDENTTSTGVGGRSGSGSGGTSQQLRIYDPRTHTVERLDRNIYEKRCDSVLQIAVHKDARTGETPAGEKPYAYNERPPWMKFVVEPEQRDSSESSKLLGSYLLLTLSPGTDGLHRRDGYTLACLPYPATGYHARKIRERLREITFYQPCLTMTSELVKSGLTRVLTHLDARVYLTEPRPLFQVQPRAINKGEPTAEVLTSVQDFLCAARAHHRVAAAQQGTPASAPTPADQGSSFYSDEQSSRSGPRPNKKGRGACDPVAPVVLRLVRGLDTHNSMQIAKVWPADVRDMAFFSRLSGGQERATDKNRLLLKLDAIRCGFSILEKNEEIPVVIYARTALQRSSLFGIRQKVFEVAASEVENFAGPSISRRTRDDGEDMEIDTTNTTCERKPGGDTGGSSTSRTCSTSNKDKQDHVGLRLSSASHFLLRILQQWLDRFCWSEGYLALTVEKVLIPLQTLHYGYPVVCEQTKVRWL